jgi:hypothetical protein
MIDPLFPPEFYEHRRGDANRLPAHVAVESIRLPGLHDPFQIGFLSDKHMPFPSLLCLLVSSISSLQSSLQAELEARPAAPYRPVTWSRQSQEAPGAGVVMQRRQSRPRL